MSGTELNKAIARGEIKVTMITGPDGGICPACSSGNAMICRGECPGGFEPHHFWDIGLDLKACRDCGHSVVASRDGEPWENESTHELFVDQVATGITTKVSDAYTIDEQHEIVAKQLEPEINNALEKSDDVETRWVK